MGMYAVQTADAEELAEMRDAARGGRAMAEARRRALAAGRSALAPTNERVRTGPRDAELRAGTNGAAPVAASNGAVAPNGAVASNGAAAPNGAAASTGAVASSGAVADGVADAHVGRAMSQERRRQLSQGKKALPAAAAALNGAGAPAVPAPAPPSAAVAGGVSDAHLGRALSQVRRRQLSQGKAALGAPVVPAAPAGSNGAGAPAAPAPAPPSAAAARAVSDAHVGRAMSQERRRQLSQGKRALPGAAGAPDGAAAPAAPAPAPGVATAAGAADAHIGRAMSQERRRQLSQGKRALAAPVVPAAAAVSAPVDRAPAGRAEARGPAGAASTSVVRQGEIKYAAKVLESPTHGGQQVTGLRIGPGVRVTGDEAGAAMPVSGSQYIAADGPPPPAGAGQKVGLARTAAGLVVSGTTVRNKVHITGDEFGEHLRITGEADQKLDDDLTPRADGSYRAAQFPRRTDPHGASAVGTRLGRDRGPWNPPETTDGGRPVTGTALGRSGRVTGNEAGAARPITGDQYQNYAAEYGGAAAAAPGDQGRLDPVTGGKVTVAQTWTGQRVTGPSLEHRPNVTGDEPGVCGPVTGTPYQGPSTAIGWCEPGQAASAAGRLDPRPPGVSVTGDVPMHTDVVTGTARGHGRTVTGTPYYSDLRAAEPAADGVGGIAYPMARAQRVAARQNAGAIMQEGGETPPPSTVPGRITGSFAVGDGKVTGNNEFLFRPRPNLDGKRPSVTGEGRTEGRTVTGSAWTSHDRVTGTEGYIAARRNPSEGGGGSQGWAGARKFREQAVTEGPRQIVTGLSGWSEKAAAKITLSGGAQG